MLSVDGVISTVHDWDIRWRHVSDTSVAAAVPDDAPLLDGRENRDSFSTTLRCVLETGAFRIVDEMREQQDLGLSPACAQIHLLGTWTRA